MCRRVAFLAEVGRVVFFILAVLGVLHGGIGPWFRAVGRVHVRIRVGPLPAIARVLRGNGAMPNEKWLNGCQLHREHRDCRHHASAAPLRREQRLE